MKADHDATMQIMKTKSLALKGKIDQLKTQINTESQKKIIKLETNITFAKVVNENLEKDYATLQLTVKYFGKDILEQMVQRQMNLNKFFKIKEYVKKEFQVATLVAKMHDGVLSIPKIEIEDLLTWLKVMIEEDLKKVSQHLKHTLFQRIKIFVI